MTDKNEKASEGPVFTIQRIYVKDISFEAPHAPDIFKVEWKPEVNVDLQTKTNQLEENAYDVSLHLTVTVKVEDKVAFLVEVNQAGIMILKGFADAQLSHVLGSLCPGILYPYAREAISDMVTKGGFPQLLLSPINFDALYLQHLEKQKEKQKEKQSVQ